MHPVRYAVIPLLLLSFAWMRIAVGDPPPDQNKHEAESSEHLSTTDGQISIDGQPLKYKATAGLMRLKDDGGKPKAEMFFVAYEKQDAGEKALRPLTFIFNGGPGAAAVWLHLGTAGPKRLALNEQGDPPSPPYHLEDNPNTWLTATDLVFIDPIGTGFSRPMPGEEPRQFYGVNEDIHYVGEFIRLYITRNNRWLSPKFLAGESYGTTRAAGLAGHLLEERGIGLNGIILISSVLNFRTISFESGNELPYALYLPSYTAIAHHFNKLPDELQKADLSQTMREVEEWATHEYLEALVGGSSITPQRHKEISAKLARYTGLAPQYIEKANLRINPGTFRKELLVDEQKVIGRFDARVAGFNPDPLALSADYDPSLPAYFAGYTATFSDYARRTLKYESDRSYDVLTGRVQPWNFGAGNNGFLDLARAYRMP